MIDRTMRRGFALLAVLWVLAGAATLALVLAATGRDAQSTSLNRARLRRARWMAEGCVARLDAAVAEASEGQSISDTLWQHLDRVIAASPLITGCGLAVVPAGMTLDVNTATAQQITRLASAVGMSASAADSLTDAILDWRDPDEEPRPLGAEREWYVTTQRAPPRNGPVESTHELQSVRGTEGLPGLDTLLGTESGRILLSRAPLPVIAALPGFGPEAIARLAERRAASLTVEVPAIAALLSDDSRRALLAAQPELASLATTVPDAWLITSTATYESHAARLELRVVRSGARLAVLQRRIWP